MTVPFEAKLQVVTAALLQVLREQGVDMAAQTVDDHVVIVARGESARMLQQLDGGESQLETDSEGGDSS